MCRPATIRSPQCISPRTSRYSRCRTRRKPEQPNNSWGTISIWWNWRCSVRSQPTSTSTWGLWVLWRIWMSLSIREFKRCRGPGPPLHSHRGRLWWKQRGYRGCCRRGSHWRRRYRRRSLRRGWGLSRRNWEPRWVRGLGIRRCLLPSVPRLSSGRSSGKCRPFRGSVPK